MLSVFDGGVDFFSKLWMFNQNLNRKLFMKETT